MKDISRKTPSRIPESKVVGPSRFVKPVTETEGTISVSRNPYPAQLIVAATSVGEFQLSDVDAPDLSDITVYTALVAKQRAVTKEIYYEIVFKVKNSSDTPNDIIGVDARIVGTEPEND